MSYSSALKSFVLLLLLALTLGWKLAARSGELGGVKARDLGEFLTRHRFTVAEQSFEGQPAIRGTMGSCRVIVTKSSPLGWERDAIRRHATVADYFFVVFGGNIYAEQPTWLTASDFLWSRFRRELGLKVRATPLLAVIASRSCEAERLPWNELS